jgi:hypothetical protein
MKNADWRFHRDTRAQIASAPGSIWALSSSAALLMGLVRYGTGKLPWTALQPDGRTDLKSQAFRLFCSITRYNDRTSKLVHRVARAAASVLSTAKVRWKLLSNPPSRNWPDLLFCGADSAQLQRHARAGTMFRRPALLVGTC